MNRSAEYIILLILLFQFPLFPGDKELKDWSRFYSKYKGEGCFVVYDLKKDTYYIYNEKRVKTGFLPASTFKIFNSLAALETGVIKDEYEIIKWDSINRGNPDWNRDHNLESAIKYSAVWFYQELARRIGKKNMQYYIDAAGYGNKDINNNIDDFWLKGKLKITPLQQIDMLVRLYKNDLPFSQSGMEIVKKIMITEKKDDFLLHSKTGWAAAPRNDVGWWIGYIEKDNNVYFFANCMEIVNEGDEKGRIEISKAILKELGIYSN